MHVLLKCLPGGKIFNANVPVMFVGPCKSGTLSAELEFHTFKDMYVCSLIVAV